MAANYLSHNILQSHYPYPPSPHFEDYLTNYSSHGFQHHSLQPNHFPPQTHASRSYGTEYSQSCGSVGYSIPVNTHSSQQSFHGHPPLFGGSNSGGRSHSGSYDLQSTAESKTRIHRSSESIENDDCELIDVGTEPLLSKKIDNKKIPKGQNVESSYSFTVNFETILSVGIS